MTPSTLIVRELLLGERCARSQAERLAAGRRDIAPGTRLSQKPDWALIPVKPGGGVERGYAAAPPAVESAASSR
jgi:hypothetical protein